MNSKDFDTFAPEKDESYNPIRNPSGCIDRTAHTAVENLDRRAKHEKMRYKNFIKAVFAICKASGFYIENRLEVKDLETGRSWR